MIQPKSHDPIQAYVTRQASSVPGYLRSLDLAILARLGRHQSAIGVRGGLLEVGVHHGKLFLLLAMMRQVGERTLGIDLFEDDDYNRRGRHAKRPTALARHAARLRIGLDAREVLRSDSTKVEAGDVIERIGAARLISIDGGHDHAVVVSDLALAAAVLDRDGIIAVDDFLNRDWPDVARATLDFLVANRHRYAAFLVTPGKLYIARTDRADRYHAAVSDDPAFAATHRTTTAVNGRDVPFMRWRLRQAVRHRLTDLFWCVFASLPRRHRLGSVVRALLTAPLAVFG